MHRTSRTPWTLLTGLAALLLSGLADRAVGQVCSPEARPLVVTLNGATRLQLSSRRPIKTVINPKEGLLTIRTIERDPTTVLLVGTSPGVTRIELEDAEGNREVREVIVQADVEYVTNQLRRAVPLSNINVIPSGTNGLILTGYVHRAEDIAVAQAVATSVGFQVINGLRLNGVQQVQLDVVIAQVERSKARFFGVNFLGNTRQTIFGSTVGNIIPGLGNVGVPGAALQPTQFGQVNSTPPGSANLFGGVIGNVAGFQTFLQALQNEGVVKVLAQPRLVTLSGNPASFLAGGEQAVPVPAGLGQVGVQFNDFGTRLQFLPIVLGNGRIHLEVEPEISTLNAAAGVIIAGATVAGRSTQRVHTTVELESGQTFVIGGLIQKVTSATASKVPVIGQLPFVGALFSTKTHSETEAELVILVTPHLVDAQSNEQVCKVLPGQETRNPDDFELFLEGILEAPRGPRAVFIKGRYVPAHRNGPTADLYPCAGKGDGASVGPCLDGRKGCGNGSCGNGGCGNGGAMTGGYLPPAMPTVAPAGPPRMQPPPPQPPEGAPATPPAGELPPGQPTPPPAGEPQVGQPAPPAAETPDARLPEPINAPTAPPVPGSPPPAAAPTLPALPMPGDPGKP